MNRIKIVISFILIVAITIPLFSTAYSINTKDYRTSADVEEGIALLEQLDTLSVDDVQMNIDTLYREKQEALAVETRKQQIETNIRKIESGTLTYREVFRDVYVAGDSLVAGLGAFDLINRQHLYARVSASLDELKRNIPRITNAKPRVLILHYGVNHLTESEKSAERFVNIYRKLLIQLKTEVPNTRIIVSLLFPVDRNIAKAKKFDHIALFNELLIDLCQELDVEYLDSTDVVNANMQYFKDDGVHFTKEFYTLHWFKHIMREMEIY